MRLLLKVRPACAERMASIGCAERIASIDCAGALLPRAATNAAEAIPKSHGFKSRRSAVRDEPSGIRAAIFVRDGLHARTNPFGMNLESIEQTCPRMLKKIRIAIFRHRDPAGGFRFQAQHQRSASFCLRFPIQKHQNRRRIFHRAPQTKPDVQRHMANIFRGNIAQIERDQTEAAALQKQIRGAQRVIQIPAAHPQQLFQFHAGRFRRMRIEGVASIHKSAHFSRHSP